MAYKILIVDDEEMMTELLSDHLQDCGYDTITANCSQKAIELLQKQPDLIILDINMPDMNGLELCKNIRNHINSPIIFVTARITEQDKINGLQYGGDDYITKPFSLKELCARVKAVIRRSEYLNITPSNNDIITCGGITVNLARRTVAKRGKFIDLTMKEFDLLTSLMLSKGRVLNRDQLMEKVWDIEFSGDARTVDVHIRYLRQKIEDDSENPRYILTVRGVGYRFASEDEI